MESTGVGKQAHPATCVDGQTNAQKLSSYYVSYVEGEGLVKVWHSSTSNSGFMKEWYGG